jgi:hypothetical protein
MVVGAALTGIGKFALPLASKYVIDVLLASQPKLDRIDLVIDRWCAGLAQAAHMTPTGAQAGGAQRHATAGLHVALLLPVTTATIGRESQATGLFSNCGASYSPICSSFPIPS